MNYLEIESLVTNAKKHDHKATNELIRYFTPFIKNFSKKIFVTGISSEDIEQDCYLELINIINIYDDNKKSFLGFFYTSLRNNIISKYKKQLNTKQVELNEELIDDSEDYFEIGILKDYAYVDLYNALNNLTPLEKDVLVKYYFNKISLKAQAKLYNKSYITLVKRKELALKKLKEALLLQQVI